MLEEDRKWRPSFKLIVTLTTLVLAAIILFQNTHEATIRLLFWRVDVSLVVLIVLVLALGYILGWLTAKFPRRHSD